MFYSGRLKMFYLPIKKNTKSDSKSVGDVLGMYNGSDAALDAKL